MGLRACIVAALLISVLSGCAAVRYADFKLPRWRFDRPHNVPLPHALAPEAQAVLEGFEAQQSETWPTPYHLLMDTPALGTFEGEHDVALAFSGGGMRGILFSAACVAELAALIAADALPVDVLAEADYVSGVSTGAIPAALFALDRAGYAPDGRGVQHWPAGLNENLVPEAAKKLPLQPHYVLRDLTLDMNTAPAFTLQIAQGYFGGDGRRLGSGRSFGDLPPTPVLLLGATVLTDPAVPFLYTRMPYRYATDARPTVPWHATVQTPASFNTDIRPYSLAEACYASLSYPAAARAAMLEVFPPRPWLWAPLEGPRQVRSRQAFEPKLSGIHALKDGGMIDNRGIDMLHPLLAELARQGRAPLLISMDAGYLTLRPLDPEGHARTQGWMAEWTETVRVNWQTAQDAVRALAPIEAEAAGYTLVSLQYADWANYFNTDDGMGDEARAKFEALCAASPLIQTPEKLLDIAQRTGTGISALSDEQMAAIRIAARFAVWSARDGLRAWAGQTGIQPQMDTDSH